MSSAYTSNIYITSARLADGYVEGWLSSETATTATIGWKIVCRQKSAALYGQEAYCYVNGTQVGFVDGYITSSSSSWKEVCSTSGTTTVNKTTASQSIPVKIKTRVCTVDGYGSVTTDYVYATCYVTVSAKTSYTVSYNANGGTGAPSSQTKWHGTNITLSTTKPTRTGYTFLGWATSSTATSANSSYDPGDTYSTNAALTLYAVWKIITYTVSYNTNGGTWASGATTSQTKTYGTALTLLTGSKISRTNYTFKGWSTSATGAVEYAAGASYTANSAADLYAVWELAYWKPKITNLTVTRCNSAGTVDEYGTYAKIAFSWELCQLIGTNTTATIAISWTGGSASVTGSGTSGTVSKVVGSGALSIESSYTFTVKVTDNTDYSTATIALPASSFAIDFKAGGTGVNFGAPAEDDGFNCAWDAYFDKNLSASGLTARGTLGVGGGGVELGTSLSSSAGHGGYIDFHYNGSTANYTSRIIEEASGTLGIKGAIHATKQIRTANNYSIGTYNTSGSYRSLAYIGSDNNVQFGYGNYSNSEGSTYYSGNTVGIRAKGHIYMTAPSAGLSARAYGVNKVLASCAYYMNSSQSVTLSEAISAQPNGIVLIWSYYNGSAYNSNFIHTFVPKHFVTAHPNGGMWCSSLGTDYVMCKYVYINDTSIVGHADNTINGSELNGVYIHNTNYVLRYVIGV